MTRANKQWKTHAQGLKVAEQPSVPQKITAPFQMDSNQNFRQSVQEMHILALTRRVTNVIEWERL